MQALAVLEIDIDGNVLDSLFMIHFGNNQVAWNQIHPSLVNDQTLFGQLRAIDLS